MNVPEAGSIESPSTELLPAFISSDIARKAAHDVLGLVGFDPDKHPECVLGINWDYWGGGGHIASLHVNDPELSGESAAENHADLLEVIGAAKQYYANRWDVSVSEVTLEMSVSLSPPRTKVRMHTDDNESFIIALDGQGSGQTKDPQTGLFLPRFHLGPGDAAFVDKRIYHGFWNTGNETRVTAVFS